MSLTTVREVNTYRTLEILHTMSAASVQTQTSSPIAFFQLSCFP